jgi:predicted RNA polymerase sigma factor
LCVWSKKWNKRLIEEARFYFNNDTSGDTITTFHLEAVIAFEHCIATSFKTTNWKNIIAHYEMLNKISPSPITELNKAVAILELDGAEAAFAALNLIKEKSKLLS